MRIFGLFLLVFGIFFAFFAYNKLIKRDLTPYFDAIISSKVVETVKFK